MDACLTLSCTYDMASSDDDDDQQLVRAAQSQYAYALFTCTKSLRLTGACAYNRAALVAMEAAVAAAAAASAEVASSVQATVASSTTLSTTVRDQTRHLASVRLTCIERDVAAMH